MRTRRWYGCAPLEQMGQGELVTPRRGRSNRACPQPRASLAQTGDLLLEEGQGLAGTHRYSADSEGTKMSPRTKYANESPHLHVIHKAFS